MDRKAMREEFEKLSTPERLDRMQAMSDMRGSRMAERAAAIRAFYVRLSPGQQHVFDAETIPGAIGMTLLANIAISPESADR